MANSSLRTVAGRLHSLLRTGCHSKFPGRLCVHHRNQFVNDFRINHATATCLRNARHFTSQAPTKQINKDTETKGGSTADPKQEPGSSKDNSPADPVQPEEKSVGLLKRFRMAYKEHGKALVGVHIVTSSVWISIFYYAAACGLDITPLLMKIGISESVIQYLGSAVGNLATAYVMYKIATPARYTVTIFGTYSTVKYLQKWGYMSPPEETIRSLVKEKYSDMKDDMKDKYADMKDDVRDKYDDLKDDVKEKLKEKVGVRKKQL